MKQVIGIVAVLVVIIGIGYLATSQPSESEPVAVVSESANVETDNGGMNDEMDTMSDDEAMVEDTAMDDTDDMSTTEVAEEVAVTPDATPVTPAAPGTYLAFSEEALAASDTEHTVVFFHASWCPSCRALDADITANRDAIPSNVTILRADFDTDTALKQEYGVVRQHSVVTLDANGNQVGSVAHPATLAQLVANL